MWHRSKAAKRGTDQEKPTLFQRFGLFFFTKTRTTLLLWLLLASFGVACYTVFMQREGFPSVTGPFSTVSGTYFVNNEEKVDSQVAKPLAQAVLKLSEVKQVNSQAGDNFFSLQIEFKENVQAADGNRKVEEVVKGQHLLPKGAEAEFKPLFISKLTPEGDDALISVASNKLTATELQRKADEVASALGEGGSAEIREVKRVHAIDNFRRGTDPATGEAKTQRRSFDWIATKQNGQVDFTSSVLVAIQAKEGGDILALDDATRQSLEKIKDDPRFTDVKVQVAADFAESVRMQVGSLQENLFGGLVAVLLVSFLFISLRASFITALSMVTVLAITVGALFVFGQTLNTITLFALILSLGLIVDDTIIMTEAIDNARRKGLKAKAAVTSALRKVALASMAGTLTTMLGFAPLLFISGIMGDFIRAIPITILTGLAVSLIVSITLIPFLARFTLLRGSARELHNPISKFEGMTAHALAQLVRRVGKSRKQGAAIGLAAILISFLMIFGGVYFMGKLKFNIFPPTKDGDIVVANIEFAPGSRLENAQRISSRVNQKIASTLGQYVRRVSYQGSGSSTEARAVIDLVSYKDRGPTAPELAQKLQAEFKDFSGAKVEVTPDQGPAPTGGFVMQIRTEQSAKAEKLGQAIAEYLRGKELKRPNGTVAHLKDVGSGAATVQRIDGKRYVEVTGDFDADDTSALVPLAQEAVKEAFPADRVQRQFGLTEDALVFDVGQEAENQESFGSMMIAFPILLLAMYLLLVAQFRSISQPLMIFLAIPFSFFGVTAGLYFTDNSFSFFTMLGIFALLGIAVNNTILLTDYANRGRREGKRRSEAMAVALEERFRPLLTTSLTSVVALAPLALTDPFWEALAVTLIFGLLSSTFLVVVAFPYYYLANELIRSRFNRWWTIGWFVVLVAGAVATQQFVGSPAGMGFAFGYLLVTLLVITGKGLYKRKKRA